MNGISYNHTVWNEHEDVELELWLYVNFWGSNGFENSWNLSLNCLMSSLIKWIALHHYTSENSNTNNFVIQLGNDAIAKLSQNLEESTSVILSGMVSIHFKQLSCRFSTLCDLLKHKLTSSQLIFIILCSLIYESNSFYKEFNGLDIALSPM